MIKVYTVYIVFWWEHNHYKEEKMCPVMSYLTSSMLYIEISDYGTKVNKNIACISSNNHK